MKIKKTDRVTRNAEEKAKKITGTMLGEVPGTPGLLRK